jgi:hypothetical protein
MRDSRVALPVLVLMTFVLSGYLSKAAAELRVSPRIKVREAYNDNIFLTAENEEDDFITLVAPGLNLGYDSGRLTASLDYQMVYRFYAKHSDRNETDPKETQRATADASLTLYKDIAFVDASDRYQRVTIDVRGPVAEDNALVNRTDSNYVRVNPYIRYPLGALTAVTLSYYYANQWYDAPEAEKWWEQGASATLSRQLSSLISTHVGYSYLAHRPERTEDYDRQTIFLGGDITLRRLTLGGEVGWSRFDYEVRESMKSMVWSASAKYLLSSLVTLTAGYSKDFTESVTLGAVKTESITSSIEYAGKIPSTITGFRNVYRYVLVDREDRETGAQVNWGIPISSRLQGGLLGRYAYYEFLPEGEKANRYSARGSIGYSLKVGELSAGYTYNRNDSGNDANDYVNNVIWAEARLEF